MRRRWVGVLLVGLAAVGCGDGEGQQESAAPSQGEARQESAAATEPLSKPAYRSRIEAAFEKTTKANKDAARTGDDRATLKTALRSLELLKKDLEALIPPKEIERAHADFTSVFAAIVRQKAAVFRAALRGDQAEARRRSARELPKTVVRKGLAARRTLEQKGYYPDIADPVGAP